MRDHMKNSSRGRDTVMAASLSPAQLCSTEGYTKGLEHAFACFGAQAKICSKKRQQYYKWRKLTSRTKAPTKSQGNFLNPGIGGGGKCHCLCSFCTLIAWIGIGSRYPYQLQMVSQGDPLIHAQTCPPKAQQSHQSGTNVAHPWCDKHEDSPSQCSPDL